MTTKVVGYLIFISTELYDLILRFLLSYRFDRENLSNTQEIVEDANYVKLLNESMPTWLDEFKDITDKRILWDLIKYRIRQVSIKYNKEKARKRREKLLILRLL